jgi:hypothetical protein
MVRCVEVGSGNLGNLYIGNRRRQATQAGGLVVPSGCVHPIHVGRYCRQTFGSTIFLRCGMIGVGGGRRSGRRSGRRREDGAHHGGHVSKLVLAKPLDDDEEPSLAAWQRFMIPRPQGLAICLDAIMASTLDSLHQTLEHAGSLLQRHRAHCHNLVAENLECSGKDLGPVRSRTFVNPAPSRLHAAFRSTSPEPQPQHWRRHRRTRQTTPCSVARKGQQEKYMGNSTGHHHARKPELNPRNPIHTAS